MPSISLPRFQWHDLPCTPHNGERTFAIYVPENETQQGRELPALGTLWNECPDWLRRAERVIPPLQSYKLAWLEAVETGRLFYFAKVKTEAERNRPYLEWQVRRMHHWPTVLLKLWFEQDNSLPLSGLKADGTVGTQPRVFERMKYRDGGQFPTTFIIRHFLSDVPWPASALGRITPITDSIHWNFMGNSGSFPECLHPRVSFPSFTTGSGNVMFGAGTPEVEIGTDLKAQEFPATTMTDWERYVVECTTNPVLGQWFREDVVAVPPVDDREVLA